LSGARPTGPSPTRPTCPPRKLRTSCASERLLTEGELSRRTIQKILVQLYSILKRAKRKGWIDANPAEDAERVTVRRTGNFRVLSPDEVHTVARADGAELYGAIYVTAAFTGLRMGEVRALRWLAVDFATASCTCGATTSVTPTARRSPSACAVCP
jgi:integrase